MIADRDADDGPSAVVVSPTGRAAPARRSWDDVERTGPWVVMTAWLGGITALPVMGFLR